MEVEVTFLSRRGTAIMRRAQRASGERVHIGRGTDNEVRLTDIHVGLRAAALLVRDGELAVERLDNSPLEVNGNVVDTAPLSPGDVIGLGPYRIEVTAPPEGCDGAIQIELAPAAGAGGPEATSRVRIGLERTGANKRVYAWIGFVVVAALFFAVPLIIFNSGLMRAWHKDTPTPAAAKVAGLSWSPGTFSNAHRFFAADCASCHEGAFAEVPDKACLACHADVGSHVPHGVELAAAGKELATLRCNDCHTEHRGIQGSVIRTADLCLDCHRDLQTTAPAAKVPNVDGFPAGHPQFRATLSDVPHTVPVRAELGGPPLIDKPGLKFSHDVHLKTIHDASVLEDRRVKGCADCHTPDAGGLGFQPITYKVQCERCHELTFEKVSLPWPKAAVPHGDDTGVIAAVWNYYAGLALRQGTGSSPAPAPQGQAMERRGAGMPAPPAPGATPGDTQAWVTAQASTALRTVVFEERRGCAYCHYSTASDGAWNVDKILAQALPPKPNPAPIVAHPMLRNNFLPNAVFNHGLHSGVPCENCHTVGPMKSDGVEALMVPGKETCAKCHGAESATLHVQSTCIDCHDFHRNEFGLMHMTEATAK